MAQPIHLGAVYGYLGATIVELYGDRSYLFDVENIYYLYDYRKYLPTSD